MQIKEYDGFDAQEILTLYKSVGWTAYTDAPIVLEHGFEHSLLTMAAYEGSKLLGIVRTVGDGHTVVLIQDILVFPEHQGKGIGSALLQAVLERFRHVRQIQLITDNTHKTAEFYRSMGFRELSQIGCLGFMRG